jgi:hypothetical protein
MGDGLVRNGSHHREDGDVDCRASQRNKRENINQFNRSQFGTSTCEKA